MVIEMKKFDSDLDIANVPVYHICISSTRFRIHITPHLALS